MINLFSRLGLGAVTGIIVVTAVTLALVGGVVVAATGVGCKVGVHISSRCTIQTAQVSSSILNSPTPYRYSPPAQVLPPVASNPNPPVASNPYPPVASNPYPPLASNPIPVRDPSWPPYQYDASSPLPPIYGDASQALPGYITLSCRLPVYAGGSGSGGFVVFPQGQFVADPRSAVTPPSPPADYTPPPQPIYGPGPTGNNLSYDRALGKWLPVSSNFVSPDGTRYAWVFPGDTGVYIIDASTGAQTEIGDGKQWNLLRVTNSGVYAMQSQGQTQLAGLWFVPFSGSPQQVTSSGYWQAVGGGAAYGTATSAVPAGATNTILRLDLKTGSSQPWFMVQNSQATVMGFDFAGSPLIADNYQTLSPYGYWATTLSVWDVPGLGTGYVIAVNPQFSWPAVADVHGVWFPGGSRIFIFIPGQGTYVAALIGGVPAGECA